jgi:O-antigen/teichoic acid export membrane protein
LNVNSQSYGRLARLGAAWSVVRELGNEIVGLGTAMVVARLLTPHDFGIAAAASFFTVMAARLTKLGLNVALVQQKEMREDHASTVCGISLITGVLVWLLLLVSGPFLGRVFRSPEAGQVLPVAGFNFIIVAFNTVPSAILYRNMMFRQSTYVDWLITIVSSISVILFAWFGFSFWSIVYSQLISNTVMVVADVYVTKWRISVRITRRAVEDLFSFGLGIYAKRLLDYCALNLDNLVVGRVLGVTALGFYEKAFNLMSRVVDRASLGAGSMLRIFALMQTEPERFRSAYRKTLMTVTMAGYPALAGAATMAHELILFMFGSQWLPSVPVFQLLCVAGMMKLVNAYNSIAIQALGQVWAEVWRQLLYVTLVVVLVATFASGGLTGAALGVLMASVVMTGLMLSLVRSLAGLSWKEVLDPHAPGLACAAGVAAFATLAKLAILASPVHPIWLVFAGQATAALLWFVAFLVWSPFEDVRVIVRDAVADFAPRFAKSLTPSSRFLT